MNGEMVREVTDVLKELGIPASILGYNYLRSAILMVMDNPKLITMMTKELYPTIAKMYDTTWSRVERAMRHAIDTTFDRCPPDVTEYYFKNIINSKSGKVTNSEFIGTIADELSLKHSSSKKAGA